MITRSRTPFFQRIAYVLLGALLCVANAWALSIEAEGIAEIKDSAVGKARVMAIQNAIRQAALQNSVQISTTTTMNNHMVTGDTARLRSSARIANVTVADEWQEDGQLHVLIRAEIVPGSSGDAESKNAARKKVAFLQFRLHDRGAAADLPELEIELARKLRKEAEARAGVLGVDAAQHSLINPEANPSDPPQSPGAEMVVRVAQELGVQFLVTGEITDTGISDDTIGHSRQVGLEVHVYDGVSGALLARQPYDEKVIGGDHLPKGIAMGSKEFYDTHYGKALAQTIRRAAASLSSELNRLPLTAKVVRSNAKKVYIDAGATSQIRVGDMLMAYKVDPSAVTDPANGKFLGHAEEPVATLVIRSVQPQFSVGEVETDQSQLKPGDVVRFAW